MHPRERRLASSFDCICKHNIHHSDRAALRRLKSPVTPECPISPFFHKGLNFIKVVDCRCGTKSLVGTMSLAIFHVHVSVEECILWIPNKAGWTIVLDVIAHRDLNLLHLSVPASWGSDKCPGIFLVRQLFVKECVIMNFLVPFRFLEYIYIQDYCGWMQVNYTHILPFCVDTGTIISVKIPWRQFFFQYVDCDFKWCGQNRQLQNPDNHKKCGQCVHSWQLLYLN